MNNSRKPTDDLDDRPFPPQRTRLPDAPDPTSEPPSPEQNFFLEQARALEADREAHARRGHSPAKGGGR